MITYRLENNVTTKLVGDINKNTTDIIIKKASYPYNNPIVPSENEIGTMTLIDDSSRPTKIEIIYFTNFFDNGDGTLTISNVQRGKENTSKQSFVSGSVVTQSLTREAINSLINGINDNSSVSMELSGDILNLKKDWQDSPAYSISLSDISNWNEAFSWGDHSSYGYLTDIKSESLGDLSDVDLDDLADKKVLKWSSYLNRFIMMEDNNTTYVSSDFNHNQLINYNPKEHIDWTEDQNGNDYVHKNNIKIIDGGTF